MTWAPKLNRREEPYLIRDEIIPLTDGKFVGNLAHDNIDIKTLELFTEPERGGEPIRNYTVEVKEDTPWKVWLCIFAAGEQIYANYETLGDTVEADDINRLQEEAEMMRQKAGNQDKDLKAHKADRDNPHQVTAAQIGLDAVDNTSDEQKPLSAAQREESTRLEKQIESHAAQSDNPHNVTKEQVGLDAVDNTSDEDKPISRAQREEIDRVAQEAAAGIEQLKAERLEAEAALQRAVEEETTARTEAIATHESDETRHLTASERQSWNDKYTKAEVDNKLSLLETAIDWKEAVETYADIDLAYPDPEDGWTVNVKDTDYTYRYNGTQWVAISANAIPKATQGVDGLMSAEDKAKLDETSAASHTHSNQTALDRITAALIDTWNAAYSHVSDAVKHITASERQLWNTVSQKADINHTHPAGTVDPENLSAPVPINKGGTGATTAAAAREALGAAATAHTHDYLPKGGVTWGQIKGV